VSRLDVRWLIHHPLRWARAVGFQLAIAALLLAKAVLITDPLWDVTIWAHLGPIALGGAAAMCIASAVAPADHRLQLTTMWTLIAVAAWRTTTYLMLVIADTSPTTTVLAEAFAIHWVVMGALATRWPVISTKAALIVTVEAGRDQGGLHAA
jgi:hypothetical protein